MGDNSPTEGERRDQRHLAALRAARAAGDSVIERTATAELLDPYWSQCRSIARGRIGGVANPLSDAEDIAQEVMRRLVSMLAKKTEFDTPFFAVVHSNLRWAIADYWRKRGKEPAVPSDPADLPEGQLEDTPSTRAELEDFDRHLRGVSGRDQEMMRERILAGRSAAEIAAAHDMTESAVNTALSRAFARLRKNFQADVRDSTRDAD